MSSAGRTTSRCDTCGGIPVPRLPSTTTSRRIAGSKSARPRSSLTRAWTNLSREMAVRYLGQDAGEAYAAAAGSADLVLVRLEPGEVRTWDFADEM